MNNFKIRLLDEENILNSNIEKLYDFIQSEKFNKIDDVQKPLLLIQLNAMRTYWRCLTARINNLLED
jgi:hypothetical protein